MTTRADEGWDFIVSQLDSEVPLRVPLVSRKDWLAEFAKTYHPGHHVTVLGPSGRGKTEIVKQMLKAVLAVDKVLEARVLHGKIRGRDDTIMRMSKELNLPLIDEGVPSAGRRKWWQFKGKDKPRGYIVRPLLKPGKTIMEENALLAREFGKTIYKSYHASRKNPVMLVCDEAHQLHNDLKLKVACEGPLMRGRPVCGVWSVVQRGRFVSYMVYDQAEHFIIFRDDDESNQERYSEIGSASARQFKKLTQSLKTKTVQDGSTISQCLYFRRSGDYMCIVDF